MRYIFFIVAIALISCKQESAKTVPITVTVPEKATPPSPEPPKPKTYSNITFRDVSVLRNDSVYIIKGRARVFEATLSYVVEDGHNELAKGFTTTSTGAPEFGEFVFSVNPEPEKPGSSLTLLLFEASAKDGSRTNVLAIPLP